MFNAIITLARGIEPNGTLSSDSISRVKKAVELYENGLAPKVIMTGAYSRQLDQVPASTEAYAMKSYAVSLGCKPDDIIQEDRSSHTLANAYFTKKLICEPNDWHNLIVVASDEHMPRVQYLFKKVFGSGYNFEFVRSKRVINNEQYQKELEHEESSMSNSHKWLDSVDDGDDRTIQELVASKLPDDSMAKLL